MNCNRVLLPLADGRWLAMTLETLADALSAGAALMPSPSPSTMVPDEPLMTADELAKVLVIPASWIEQKARENAIPSLEFGRWRRFKRSEVEQAVRKLRGAA